MESRASSRLTKSWASTPSSFTTTTSSPADLDWPATLKGVAEVKKVLDGEGLFVEIIAPRLWEDPRTIDGAFTSNNPADRKYALDRSRRCVDIAREVGCKNYVLWLAREGSYIREAKCAKTAVAPDRGRLERDSRARQGDPRPGRGQAQRADGPGVPAHRRPHGRRRLQDDRPEPVGRLDREHHSILAGLDPADDMAYALYHDKLWSVHLNDQNGLKYDQDKVFGSVDLRRAFDQVWTLEKNGYGRNGECVGLDVKAMRTTTFEESTLSPLALENDVPAPARHRPRHRREKVEEFRANRQYEQLEMLILNALMGRLLMASCLRSKSLLSIARHEAPVDRLQRDSPGGIGSRPSRVVIMRSYIRWSRSSLTAWWPGIAGQVAGLVRVVVQVEQPLIRARAAAWPRLVAILSEPAAGADDQLEPRRADHRLLVLEILAEDHVVALRSGLIPDQGFEVDTLQARAARAIASGAAPSAGCRSSRPGRRCDGRSGSTRPAHDQRDPHGRFVEAVLLEPPVLAEHVAVVADVDDQRPSRELPFVEAPDQPPDLRIDERERRVIRRLDAADVVGLERGEHGGLLRGGRCSETGGTEK